jgi:hypothetical protein
MQIPASNDDDLLIIGRVESGDHNIVTHRNEQIHWTTRWRIRLVISSKGTGRLNTGVAINRVDLVILERIEFANTTPTSHHPIGYQDPMRRPINCCLLTIVSVPIVIAC